MPYFPTGDISSSSFNCTKYPGVCKPMTFDVLNTVRDMQNQINRIAKVKGMKLIATDGDIGPGTVAAVAAVLAQLAPMTFDTSSSAAVAAVCDKIGARAKEVADGLGAPTQVAAPIPLKQPSIIMPSGLEVKAPPMVGASLIDGVKNLGMTTLILLGVAAAGAGYYLTRKPKKGR